MTLRIAKLEEPHRKGQMSMEKPLADLSNGLETLEVEPEVKGIPGLVQQMIGKFSCQDYGGVQNGYSERKRSAVKLAQTSPSQTPGVPANSFLTSTQLILQPRKSQDQINTSNSSVQDVDQSGRRLLINSAELRNSRPSKSNGQSTGVSQNTGHAESTSVPNGTSGVVEGQNNTKPRPLCPKPAKLTNSNNSQNGTFASSNISNNSSKSYEIQQVNGVVRSVTESPEEASHCGDVGSRKSAELSDQTVPHTAELLSLNQNHNGLAETTLCNDNGTKDVSQHPHMSNGSVQHDEKNGRYFMNVMSEVESELSRHCAELDELLASGPIPDEAAGRIRAAIGKANLLITKKFKQFHELCQNNLNQSSNEQFKTTSEDLTGFWDLVQLQVEDVRRLFREIYALRANNWIERETEAAQSLSPTKSDAQAKEPQHTPAPKKARSSKTPDTSRARDEARKRLLAAKAAGRQRKASETEEDVQIFIA